MDTCFKESFGSCFPRNALFASAAGSGLSPSSFPGDSMKTGRGLECDTRGLEATGFFLGGNTEFSCTRKSRPGKGRKCCMHTRVPNLKHVILALTMTAKNLAKDRGSGFRGLAYFLAISRNWWRFGGTSFQAWNSICCVEAWWAFKVHVSRHTGVLWSLSRKTNTHKASLHYMARLSSKAPFLVKILWKL